MRLFDHKLDPDKTISRSPQIFHPPSSSSGKLNALSRQNISNKQSNVHSVYCCLHSGILATISQMIGLRIIPAGSCFGFPPCSSSSSSSSSSSLRGTGGLKKLKKLSRGTDRLTTRV